MERMSIGEVVAVVQGEWINRGAVGSDTGRILSHEIGGISIDSRTIQQGELFFAIPGDRFDGHDFAGEAVHRGACGVVVSHPIEPVSVPIIAVDDTIVGLGDLAADYRKRFEIPLVAVTGSNGKTSTKEMVAKVMSTSFCVLKTEGNLNNHLGLPLTLFRLSSAHEAAVVEMGMSAHGEIARLTAISRPQVGVVTNVGPSHLEQVGDVADVARAKSELLLALEPEHYAVLNADDPYLPLYRGNTRAQVITFGIDHEASVMAQNVQVFDRGSGFTVDGVQIHIVCLGRMNVLNALAAISVGKIFGVSVSDAGSALHDVNPSPMRAELIQGRGIRIINDTYNANPRSFQAAIDLLRNLEAPRRIAVCGDMLELGRESQHLHQELGRELARAGMDVVVGVGEACQAVAEGARQEGMENGQVYWFLTKKGLLAELHDLVHPGDLILVKGSRGMEMEEVVRVLAHMDLVN
jgi:UDP-N-acetylmuramoyl-tripeptide--D-alanyl-D-alanine ligase